MFRTVRESGDKGRYPDYQIATEAIAMPARRPSAKPKPPLLCFSGFEGLAGSMGPSMSEHGVVVNYGLSVKKLVRVSPASHAADRI
jgi:hypothetical protein